MPTFTVAASTGMEQVVQATVTRITKNTIDFE
jgi:hypothetical protein